MYEKVVTKSGDVIWLKTEKRLMRHEIARLQFARWELSRERDQNREKRAA